MDKLNKLIMKLEFYREEYLEEWEKRPKMEDIEENVLWNNRIIQVQIRIIQILEELVKYHRENK